MGKVIVLLFSCSPLASSFALNAAASTLHRPQLRLAGVAAPHMLAFGKKPQDLGPSEEVQAALRLLGVTEDANYEEVTGQFQELCSKYKGETKRLIKLQVAKDRVLEYRLAQRMAGTYTGSTNANNMDIGDNRKEAKKPLLRVPPWAEQYISLPKPQELARNIALFCFFSALPLVSRKWISAAGGLGMGSGFFLLYNRGQPMSTAALEETQTREVKQKPVIIAALLTIFSGIVGGIVTSFLPLAYFMGSLEAAVVAGLNLGFFTSCSFFKVQDEY